MTRPITLLLVIDHLHTGGAQEFLLQLCKNLPRDRIRISVCALRGGGLYLERLDRLGIPVIGLAPSGYPAWRPFAVARLDQLLRSGRYQLLHTLLEGSFAAGTPLAWLAGIPSIHSLMAIRRQVPRWYFPLMNLYQLFISSYCTFAPDELLGCGVKRTKISAVEVAIDISDMLVIERDCERSLPNLSISPADFLVVSIARLFPDKGHEYAIRAWPHVLQRLPNARLLIVGDGADGVRLQALITELGLNDQIIMAGFRSDLAAILSRADLFVRTSINEGVNLITIQSMAAGLPVVGFSSPVPKQIIVDGHNGRLVELKNYQALADAIIELGEDGELRRQFGQTARAAVRDYYDFQLIVRHYLQLYEAITSGEAPTSVPDMLTRAWPFTSAQPVR